MSPLAAQYAEAFAENCQLDPGSWFEEDTPRRAARLAG